MSSKNTKVPLECMHSLPSMRLLHAQHTGCMQLHACTAHRVTGGGAGAGGHVGPGEGYVGILEKKSQ